MMTDTDILKLSIDKLSSALDKLIDSCIDGEEIKAPSKGDIMQARACLPKGYKNSFNKPKQTAAFPYKVLVVTDNDSTAFYNLDEKDG